MPEHLLRVLLSELTLVRVVCQRTDAGQLCGGTVEVPLDRLHQLGQCPVCHNHFNSTDDHRFIELARVIRETAALQARAVRVEFVLAVPSVQTATPQSPPA